MPLSLSLSSLSSGQGDVDVHREICKAHLKNEGHRLLEFDDAFSALIDIALVPCVILFIKFTSSGGWSG